MAMVDLRTVKDEGPELTSNSDVYLPTLYLSCEQCEALGIPETIKAGQQVMIRAIAIVRSATTTTDDDEVGEGEGDVDVSLSLQITDMDVTVGGDSSAKASDALYGDDSNG